MPEMDLSLEMNSTIEQTAESIQSNVNKKLEDYSTTEEMNSTITQTAETINTEVSKKAGKNEVCSIVSQSADAINIKANRISIESTNFKLSKAFTIDFVLISGKSNLSTTVNLFSNTFELKIDLIANLFSFLFTV